ncbi:MAG: hypothetical protein K2K83_05570 [Rikenella sp.]|nr:hypothetical protein [Rikenella sp.]
MYSVGNGGFGWSSSASGNNGYFLGLYYNGLYPNSYSRRAHGFQLRCLQE